MEDPYDLDDAWHEVLKAFEKAARVKLSPDKLLSIQDVVDQLEASRRNNEAQKRYPRLKKALGRTLECIRNLSQLASQDQSGFLQPSNLVYAAIVTLINAGKAYSMIYERLEELFALVADALERIDVRSSTRLQELMAELTLL